jgi:hypothetical protein
MAKWPGEPRLWTEDLRRRGAAFALVDLPEIDRLSRSGFIDPRVSVDAVRDWMTSHTTLVRPWPDQGVYLVALQEPAPPTTAGGTP